MSLTASLSDNEPYDNISGEEEDSSVTKGDGYFVRIAKVLTIFEDSRLLYEILKREDLISRLAQTVKDVDGIVGTNLALDAYRLELSRWDENRAANIENSFPQVSLFLCVYRPSLTKFPVVVQGANRQMRYLFSRTHC